MVFVKGAILKLDEALEQRKEIISDCINGDHLDVIHRKVGETFYVGVITNEEGYNLYWTTFSDSRINYNKIPLFREELTLSGYVFHAKNDIMNFLTFCKYCHPQPFAICKRRHVSFCFVILDKYLFIS